VTLRAWLPDGSGWTGPAYGRLRLLVGAYLAVHFVALVPWGGEVFSSEGMLPDGTASPLLRLFPNILAVADGPAVVTTLLVTATAVSVLFAVGIADRAGALCLAYVLACLYGRNPLIANPSLPYVGWLLLAHACAPALPAGAGLWRRQATPWEFPPAIHAAAWFALAAGYSFSGYTKLVSPSWLDGTAVSRVLASPLARPGALRELLLGAPPLVHQTLTWAALGLELFFLPLALFPRVRPWLWGAMLGMHVGLMAVVDFADLSVAMVLFHLFVADPRWARRSRSRLDVA
jgi:hypothetical protein